MILFTIDFSKAFDSIRQPPFSINSFRLAFLLALIARFNLSFLIGALVWFIKIIKIVSIESVGMFHKDPFLSRYFSLSSSIIFLFFVFFPSAALFMLTIYPFDFPPPCSYYGGAHKRSSFRLERWSEH